MKFNILSLFHIKCYQIHPQDFSEEFLKTFKEGLVHYFTEDEAGKEAMVTSMFFYKLAQR